MKWRQYVAYEGKLHTGAPERNRPFGKPTHKTMYSYGSSIGLMVLNGFIWLRSL